MSENELIDTLRDVTTRLGDLGIEYMVTGSMAMSSYVTARATLDIDVIIEIKQADEEPFEQRFAGDYYVSLDSIREARKRDSMFNVVNFRTGVKVDFIIRKPNTFEIAKFNRRRRWAIDDVECWVISRDDLVLSKLEWARDSHSERQFEDIRTLIESGADELSLIDSIEKQGLEGVWRAYTEWKIRIQK
jgi:hypothetical protein